MFLAIAIVGLVTIGARLPFMIALAGALFLFGGYRALQTVARWRRAHAQLFRRLYDHRRRDASASWRTAPRCTASSSRARERARTPTTYYVPGSGVGQAMHGCADLYGPTARVGVVGLGTGTLACYAQPGQQWRFYEIDPAVVAHRARFGPVHLPAALPAQARRSSSATRGCASPRRRPAALDLLALDAFSSDAVPMHLMTREAFATYARVLAPDGLLLVHISNRFLELEPVVAAAARGGGWQARRLNYVPSPIQPGRPSSSLWIAMSRDPATMAALTRGDRDWQTLRVRAGFAGWTDDYSTILPLMKGF